MTYLSLRFSKNRAKDALRACGTAVEGNRERNISCNSRNFQPIMLSSIKNAYSQIIEYRELLRIVGLKQTRIKFANEWQSMSEE